MITITIIIIIIINDNNNNNNRAIVCKELAKGPYTVAVSDKC